MSGRTPYAEIPQTMRDLLDEIYDPEGVELWWNARQKPLDGKTPDEMWHGYGTRNRVISWVEYLTGGAW